MEEDDLTSSEGEPTPRSLVKISLEIPMGGRFEAESVSPAVALLLVASALGISGGIPVVVIAAAHGPAWLMALFGIFAMAVTTFSAQRFARFTWRDSAPGPEPKRSNPRGSA